MIKSLTGKPRVIGDVVSPDGSGEQSPEKSPAVNVSSSSSADLDLLQLSFWVNVSRFPFLPRICIYIGIGTAKRYKGKWVIQPPN